MKLIPLLTVQPSQLFISSAKYTAVDAFMQVQAASHNYEPIPVKYLDGELVFLDGHTRAVWLFHHEFFEISIYFDQDELDWDLMRTCVALCKRDHIRSITNLATRIIAPEEYEVKWYGLCRKLQEFRS